MTLEQKLRRLLHEGALDFPLPGAGATHIRHRRLAELAREDVSLARLAEAHTDAVAILAEAGREARLDTLYGVWASEVPHQVLRLELRDGNFRVSGTKMFCSGASLVDRALLTARIPAHQLIDLDLRRNSATISYSDSDWITTAFADTRTATTTFQDAVLHEEDLIGKPNWYLDRPGFWHGACGPAACWAGGAMGLVDYARDHLKGDAHGLAHLGAMQAASWAMQACLEKAGREIDRGPDDRGASLQRALSLRHIVEHFCYEILQRFGRASGPRPLAFDAAASKRYQEVELYIRQCHAEHDLEILGQRIAACAPHETPELGTVGAR
jgi:alkylation response protein AidB-like acyl-CoA dehydrogenase